MNAARTAAVGAPGATPSCSVAQLSRNGRVSGGVPVVMVVVRGLIQAGVVAIEEFSQLRAVALQCRLVLHFQGRLKAIEQTAQVVACFQRQFLEDTLGALQQETRGRLL